MKHVKFYVLFVSLLPVFFAGSCKEKPLTTSVMMLRGNATFSLENSTIENPLKLGDVLNQGDMIQTGDNSGVVLSIRETGSYVEIQSNSVFRLSSLKNDKIELHSQRGNVWVTTGKKSTSPKENYFKVVTPTIVAAARGTTFYVFHIEDMEGVCHCQGDVEVTRSSSDYKGEHHTDNLIISKGDRSVLLTAGDLKKIGLQHNHSMFEKSPVGPQNQLTPKEYQTFVAYLRKRLAEAKVQKK